mmetsp:Transcript_26127/g.43181  ORF Transcript_26127/g.43181 Transcript_26127/m.43181 type:complete len:173 (+) Transcript_26127:51-569(+)
MGRFGVVFAGLMLQHCPAYIAGPRVGLNLRVAASELRRPCSKVAQNSRSPSHLRCAWFTTRELEVGAVWEGRVSQITDYGCFVRLGVQQHVGLIHVSQVASERIEKDQVPSFMEERVGPVGSKVRVEVLGLSFKGTKRVRLSLLEVLSTENVEELVFARGPRRHRDEAGNAD